jgi:hypothetical protein
MAELAYICLSDDQEWTLYYGDGSESERYPLAVGASFEPGEAIIEAVAALEAWAHENGYTLIVPHYGMRDAALQDLIEPEVFEEVFRNSDQGL